MPMPDSQNTQPPLSQLWSSFGAAAAAAPADLITGGVFNGGVGVGAVGETLNTSASNHNNNNYVDFNQFIMQHNLLGGGGGGAAERAGGGGANASAGSALPQHSSGAINNGDMGDGFFGFSPTAAQKTSTDLENISQVNYFNPNSNLFQYNNGATGNNTAAANVLYANGLNNYNNTPSHNSYYDNVYTPFGNTMAGGTTYFANPFATGFDFSASNLQASAPEFVPRFSNLSLNEEGTTLAEQLKNEYNQTKLKEQQKEMALKQLKATQEAAAVMATGVAASEQTEHAANLKNVKGSNSNNRKNDSKNASTGDTAFSPSAGSTGTTSKTRVAALNGLPPTAGGGGGEGGSNRSEKMDKAAAARAERERERDNRRYQNGRRSVDFDDRLERGGGGERVDRYERSERGERNERAERGDRYERGERTDRGERSERGDRGGRGRDYHQRYDNHRSNKRRDDWNRNRDRINGFRVEEKYSQDNGKDSPLPSPEKKPSPKKVYPENEKLSQREKLIRDIETRRLECLVCVEPIKAHHSVWSCHNCYHILHLQCIIKWASSSKSDDGWRCPACQNVVKDVPHDYYCFCGKVKNPPYNRQEIAHSCGEVCGRIEGCPHACTLLCHPGPCPPCQANVKRECGCGKTTKTMQCCLKEAIECDALCSKLLNCELHTCTAKCHTGKCAACTEKVDQTCHCSKQERQVACTRDSHDKHNYSCGKPCGRDLSCGNHKCKDCCHAGECRTCKLSPELVTSCPCGKMPLVLGQRANCLDAIPVCEGVCGKTLRCGKAAHPHHCTSKCHLGNCPPCNKMTAVKCRCGHMDMSIKCRQLSTRADDARCKKRCVKKRSCGKHKCNQECCIDIDHICPLPCNYTLSCGKHKCDQPCHRGNCPPCYRSSFEELFCECGAEVIYPPVPCGTKRPICKRHCSRTHPCAHPPQHNCHSAASCPPCMMFTTQWCYGQHEQRKTIPCSQQSFSCGLACSKPLPCGRHKCIKSCHEGICQTPSEICKQSCTTLRPACGHKCMAPCHDGDCPESPCKEMVEVQCECGNRKQMRSCHDLAREYSRIATAQLASSMAEMQRGNYMELSEILAPVKANKTNKTLDCNEECRLLERNRRLAIGLQIRNPDLPQKLMTKYSDFIRNFAKRDPGLVKNIYDALGNLVKLAKESKQKSRSHSFPTMNREKRQLVHEMCEMFGVESVAYDAEPNRNVVATAHRDRSWLPATSIMEVMQRESGQRRVPVPSNNAWGIKR